MRLHGVLAPVLTTVVGCGASSAPVNAPMNEAAERAPTASSAAPLDIPPLPPPALQRAAAAPVSPVSSAAYAPAPLPASVPLPLAKAIEGFYAKAWPFECDFAIDSFSKASSTRTTSQMHLVFVRPGELYAAFSTGEVVMVHAQVLSMVDPNQQLAYRQVVPVDFCPSALAYAGGPGSLTNHLSFVAYPGSVMNAPGLDCLVGTPNRSSPEVMKALFYADSSGEVKRTMIVSLSGDRVRFDATRCKTNIAPRPSPLFALTVPAGTTLSTPVPSSGMTRALP